MKKNKIKIKTVNSDYSVYVGSNLIKNFGDILKKEKILFNKFLLVIDNNVDKKNISLLKTPDRKQKKYIYNFMSSERNKNYKSVEKILKLLLKHNFSRNDCIIAMGGGITGDLVGFAASIYKRGIKFINIPTTLLAQVDASIGGKTGINEKSFGKNLIGTFFQPSLVLSDTIFLKTLSKKNLICGYAEIFKHSLIDSKSFFNFLDQNYKKILSLNSRYLIKAILNSCKIKKKVVEKDIYENEYRKVLNLGHTFGHAYEAAAGFGKNLNHGEGVLLGIKSAAIFSLEHKYISKNNYLKIIGHLEKINFDLKLKKYFRIKDIDRLLSFMMNDKKNKTSRINLILLKNIGRPIINKSFSRIKLKKFFKEQLIYI
tara:strand:+ start:161 stop:1273 length:1113 start_codon:yes stop_codon:yes gene_type:complete